MKMINNNKLLILEPSLSPACDNLQHAAERQLSRVRHRVTCKQQTILHYIKRQ